MTAAFSQPALAASMARAESGHDTIGNPTFPTAWIAALSRRIYLNECAGQEAYLLYWSEKEPFPSLGIGHFIWFPKGVNPSFEETFPQMLAYVSQRYSAPLEIKRYLGQSAPWANRETFLVWSNSAAGENFRQWLMESMAWQTEFILQRFWTKWQQALAEIPLTERDDIRQKSDSFIRFQLGFLAMVDYFNFKGLGDSPQERYQGEGWGLIQVFRSMLWHEGMSEEQLLDEFISAAKARLALRVRLAENKQIERQWLKGWNKRLDGYKKG